MWTFLKTRAARLDCVYSHESVQIWWRLSTPTSKFGGKYKLRAGRGSTKSCQSTWARNEHSNAWQQYRFQIATRPRFCLRSRVSSILSSVWEKNKNCWRVKAKMHALLLLSSASLTAAIIGIDYGCAKLSGPIFTTDNTVTPLSCYTFQNSLNTCVKTFKVVVLCHMIAVSTITCRNARAL